MLMFASVEGLASPTAHPSVEDNMKTEFSGGFAGGLMYADGLMSLQAPSTPVSGAADTVSITRDIDSSMIEKFALRIKTNC